MDPYRRLLLAARERVTEVGPNELGAATLVDIREPHELAVGVLPGAHAIPMQQLVDRIGSVVADKSEPVVLYCAVGERSLIAAAILQDHGYTDVVSLAGGIKLWMEQGRHTETTTDLSDEQRQRFARHIVLPGVGAAGQSLLLDAKIAIVGAGGLGSPAAMYLAAAGVGTLGLVDFDTVDLSNLQRQLLHRTSDAGRAKIESAAETLHDLNPGTKVVGHATKLAADNAESILGGYDIIIDGTDNFATRYLLNDVSLRLGTPVVHGSVFRFEGQVSVFSPYVGPCYRCLFPEPPPAELAPNCAEAGVFGVLPGVVGTMQATEALKLLLGVGTPLIGRLVTYDALEQSTHTVTVRRDPECESCGDQASPPELRDEADYC